MSKYPKSIRLIIKPLAFIHITSCMYKPTFSVSFIIFEPSFINWPIFPYELSSSLYYAGSFYPFSFVKLAVPYF